MLSSRGCSRPRGQTHVSCVSCTGRQILCHHRPGMGVVVPDCCFSFTINFNYDLNFREDSKDTENPTALQGDNETLFT